ncbi:hypothetical protein E2320_009206 [Naja naja]|nr:hypothetical protein E2320_009206 [Naja naja]
MSRDDPEVVDAVAGAITALNEDRSHGNKLALSVILHAYRITSPGKKFLIIYQVRETMCPIAVDKPWQRCKLLRTSKAYSGNCTADIDINESEQFTFISQNCKISQGQKNVEQSHAQCLGCWRHVKTLSRRVLRIVRHTIRQFNNQSQHSSLFGFPVINEAESQVVNGVNYHFKYSIKETNCSKKEFANLSPECKPLSGGLKVFCKAKAYVDNRGTLIHSQVECSLEAEDNMRTLAQVCPGCHSPIAPDSQELKRPLEAIMKLFKIKSSSDFYFKIVEITKISGQMLVGHVYRIDFKAQRTNCSKAEVEKPDDSCTVELMTCHALIYVKLWEPSIAPEVTCKDDQPFQDYELEEPNILEDERTIFHDYGRYTSSVILKLFLSFPRSSEAQRSFSHLAMEVFILLVLSVGLCQASPVQDDVSCDDPEVFEAVARAITELNEDRTEGNKFALNVILHAHRIANVVRSIAKCLGCWHPIDPKSLEVLPIVRFTIRQFNNQSQQSALYEVREMKTATRQVVNGWNYNLEYSIKETNCSKNEFLDLSPACRHLPEGKEGFCTVTAYVDNANTLVRAEQDCKVQVEEKVEPPIHLCPGCPIVIARDSPELKEPLRIIIESFNAKSNADFHFKIVGVKEATKQEWFPCHGSVHITPWKSFSEPEVTCSQAQTSEIPADILLRVPPGFTPFRNTDKVTTQTEGLNVVKAFHPDPRGRHTHEKKRGFGHAHKHRHGHRHRHKKPTESSSEEVTVLPPVETPTQLPTSKAFLEQEAKSGSPHEELFVFSDISPVHGSSTDFPIFSHQLPDLPEPPKCPGTPWKPKRDPEPLDTIFNDFDLLDALQG